MPGHQLIKTYLEAAQGVVVVGEVVGGCVGSAVSTAHRIPSLPSPISVVSKIQLIINEWTRKSYLPREHVAACPLSSSDKGMHERMCLKSAVVWIELSPRGKGSLT